MATKKPIPHDLLLALAARDYSLVAKIALSEAERQMNHTAIKFTAVLPKIEAEFKRVTGQEPWRNVRQSDIEIYQRRIAHLAEFLTVKHLVDDIRAVGRKAHSLKYFIVPGKESLSRWETHKLDRYERQLAEEAAQQAREIEAVQIPGMDAPKLAEETVPDWVEKACADLERLKNAEQHDEARRLVQRTRGQGYKLEWIYSIDHGYIVTAEKLTKEPSHAH